MPNRGRGLILLFESFGFKHGVPLTPTRSSTRCPPNPYYDAAQVPLTGLDAPVIDFLESQYEVRSMREDITLSRPGCPPIRDNRNYLTVAIM